MLSIREYMKVIEKGTVANQRIQDKGLSLELRILKRELDAAQRNFGLKKELSLVSCEYYANEVKRSIDFVTMKL